MLEEKVKDDITSLLMRAFFNFIKERYEELLEQKALTKASEGSKKYIEENLSLISKEYLEDLEDVTVYNEEELRKIFNKYYDEFGMNIIEDDIQEELWQRFLLFAPRCLEKYNKSISFGEKRILEKTREIQEDLKKSTRELRDDLKSARVDKELLRKLAECQSELRKRLVQNIDVPYIDFNKLYGVEISDYKSKYVFYDNTFDFDKTEDRNYIEENDDVYIFRFLIKNIGYTNIEKISIENFQIMYAEEVWDDNPEIGFYVLPITEHSNIIEKYINILPYGEEFVQVVITKREEELSEEEQINRFMDEYQFERLYVTFDMRLKGNEERGYSYILFLSKRNGQNNESINGLYTIDYSVFTII